MKTRARQVLTNPRLAGLALLLLAGTSWAQVGGLMNAEVSERTSISDPARAVRAAEDQWIAFSVPVLEGTRSPCCWKGSWNLHGEVGCSLEQRHESYGTRSDSPLAENVMVYARISAGEVRALRVVGEHCPVDGGGAKVRWIGTTDDAASLKWLNAVARSGNRHSAGSSALYAMALHRSSIAGERLYALAKGPDEELSGEAIFWLANSDDDNAVAALAELLTQ